MEDDPHIFLLAGCMQRRKRRTRAGWTSAARIAKPQADVTAAHRSPAQRTGDQGEDRALALLTEQGLQLLARNLCCAAGEIDLIMRDDNVLVFVEVRARGSRRYGGAAASIGIAKRQRLQRAALFFLPMLTRQHWHGVTPRCRFDVVALEADGPVWLRATMES